MVTEKRLLEKKGITREYIEGAFEKDIESTKKILDKWLIDSKGMGIFLKGISGSGKTFVGCYLVHKILEKKYPAYRIVFSDLKEMYMENYKKFPKHFRDKDVLFVDDINPKYLEGMSENFKDLLKLRKERNTLTILSSQYGLDYYDDKLSGFIKTAFFPINLAPIDFRERQWEKAQEEFIID